MSQIRKTPGNPLGLPPFEGDAVTELGIVIPSAGGGFQEPLEVDTQLLDMLAPVTAGDKVYVVLELVKRSVIMKPAKEHDGWRRVDVFGVDGVAIIEAQQAIGVVQEQRRRVEIAKERALGITHLPGTNDGYNEGAAV